MARASSQAPGSPAALSGKKSANTSSFRGRNRRKMKKLVFLGRRNEETVGAFVEPCWNKERMKKSQELSSPPQKKPGPMPLPLTSSSRQQSKRRLPRASFDTMFRGAALRRRPTSPRLFASPGSPAEVPRSPRSPACDSSRAPTSRMRLPEANSRRLTSRTRFFGETEKRTRQTYVQQTQPLSISLVLNHSPRPQLSGEVQIGCITTEWVRYVAGNKGHTALVDDSWIILQSHFLRLPLAMLRTTLGLAAKKWPDRTADHDVRPCNKLLPMT